MSIRIAEAARPDQHRPAACHTQVDLGFTIANDVHVRRFVIVQINDNSQPLAAQHRNHATI
jgi:hypothetical protein